MFKGCEYMDWVTGCHREGDARKGRALLLLRTCDGFLKDVNNPITIIRSGPVVLCMCKCNININIHKVSPAAYLRFVSIEQPCSHIEPDLPANVLGGRRGRD